MRARRRPGLRWLAGSTGLAAAAAMVLAMTPAHAGAATVDAQLSLSGVATRADVLGGTTVGVHPGDTVDFQASALPTAGLDNVPALGPLLHTVLGTLGGQFQVVVHFGANVPGVGGTSVTLGGPTSGTCAGRPDLPVSFPGEGTYPFSWSVQYVLPSLFGCARNGLNSAALNQLRQAGVAINASNRWVGRVTVAKDPPKGGVSVQLPGVGAAPSLPVVGKLPGVSRPPVTLPTLPVTVPSLGDLPVPGRAGRSGAAGDGSSAHTGSGLPKWTPPGLSVPEQVVPKGYGPQQSGPSGYSHQVDALTAAPGVSLGRAESDAPANPASPVAAHSSASAPSPTRTVPAAALLSAATTDGHGQPMPVLLAIVAIIALSLVTALYARTYLLRKK